MTETRPTSPMSIRNRPENSPEVATAAIVEAQISSLVETWRSLDVPSLNIYETLRDCVLPKSRPAEIFLYPRSIMANRIDRLSSPGQVRSVGMLLVQAALKAGRVDELVQAIEARRSQPTAEPFASVLLAQLAIASGKEAMAGKVLGELETRLQRDSLQNSAELSCHAALPAMRNPALAATAAPLLERAAKNLASRVGADQAWELQRILARYWFSKGELAKAGKVLEDALGASELDSSRYAGQVDYALSRRNQAYLKVSSEYDLAGRVDETLDLLGRCCDGASERSGGSTTALSTSLLRQLVALPAAERYAKLKVWTIPTPTCVSARLAAGMLPEEMPPSNFGVFTPSPSCSRGVASTIGLLIDAAKELGKLDELGETLRVATEKKAENAEALYLLVEIARGRGAKVAARISSLADGIHGAIPTAEETLRSVNMYVAGRRRSEWPDFLLVRACLEDPQLSSLGERMANDLLKLGSNPYLSLPLSSLIQTDLIAWRWNQAGGRQPTPVEEYDLKHWMNSSPDWSITRQPTTSQRGAWFSHENHLGNPGVDGAVELTFPLSGSFEFSIDAYIDTTSAAHFSYGGTQITIGGKGQGTARRSGTHEQIVRYSRYVKPDAFNRLTLVVDRDKLRFLVNGHLFHEQANSSESSPWVKLSETGHVVFRNPTLSGTPVIPRSIRLSGDEALEGWNALSYNETRPTSAAWEAAADEMTFVRSRGNHLDWSMRDGLIVGRRAGAAWTREFAQSRLVSNTALHDGETLRYQFFYVPDEIEVHPALGRLAFLLEPEGVRLHWMTSSNSDNDWTGAAAENSPEDTAHRRGPDRLPLKAKDWNTVELKINGDVLKIELNETLVHERPLDRSQNRVFGLYHDKGSTEARVRSVVLEGDWPKTPPLKTDELLATVRPVDETTRRAHHAILGEATLVLDAGSVCCRSRELSPVQRYEALRSWVLPSDDHSTIRLQGDFAPTDPAPSSKEAVKDQGGEIESPALELVAVAKELGELEALANRVSEMSFTTDLDLRAQLSLLALIRSGQGRAADVAPLFEQLRPLVVKVPADAPEWQRWPELIALSRVKAMPANGPAGSLIDELANVDVKPGDPIPRWLRHARHLRGLARNEPGGEPGKDCLWRPVLRGRAQGRGEGDPNPIWSLHDGEWSRTPGDADASLELGVPLRPPFEVELELKSTPACLTQVAYAGLRIGLDAKGEVLKVANSGRSMPDVAIAPPLEANGPWYVVRLVVRTGAITAFVGARKVFEQAISDRPEPWLSIHSAPGTAAMARRIRVSGSPEIPRVVGLSESPILDGWSANYYQEATSGANAVWEKRGEEITGAFLKPTQRISQEIRSGSNRTTNPADLYALPGSRCESVLQYRHPLLGDGEVEYEFFYEPGKSVVHPALDRLTFLLGADGVKVHWMTDAQYERTGLRPENAIVETANRRGPDALPLKAREWNRVKLSLKDNRATLQLNDVTVYERPIEVENSKVFGLFHYADESQARVRHVKLRGNWPKTVGSAN